MKDIDELNLPDDIRYSEDHEYARPINGKIFRMGINDHAQDQLGDIVYIELPDVGDRFEQGSEFGTIESVKSVVELYMPVGGKILTINSQLENSPEIINNDPYGEGWMIEVESEDPDEYNRLMTRDDYLNMMKGQS